MNFSSSLKRSFKNHTRRISIENQEDPHHEQKPILSEHKEQSVSYNPSSLGSLPQYQSPRMATPPAPIDRHEVIVNIDPNMEKDPPEDPNKLIGQFLNDQKIPGRIEQKLDLDLEMDELRIPVTPPRPPNSSPALLLPPNSSPHLYNTPNGRVSTSSKDVRVSFQVDIPPDEKQAYAFKKPCEVSSSSEEEQDVENRREHGRKRSNLGLHNDVPGAAAAGVVVLVVVGKTAKC